jgi:DNA repair exonuclease SbcCD ATPase subunit
MSDSLQLGRIEIKNFRLLSEPCHFTFAEGPGVTILVGPNASGKSTVLDAIEYALTGTVSRFPVPSASSRAPNIFRTLGSNEDPEVVLTFVDDDQVAHRVVARDGEEQVTALLRRRDYPWSEIKSVAAALRWTHFSSQRSIAKLGYEDGEAILKAFAAPAGLERLKGIDRRLWGRDTRSALKDLERVAAQNVRQHEAALELVGPFEASRFENAHANMSRRITELRTDLSRELGSPVIAEVGSLDALESTLSTLRSEAESRLAMFRTVQATLRDSYLRTARLAVEEDEAAQSLATAEGISARRVEALNAANDERERLQQDVARLTRIRSEIFGAISAKNHRAELQENKTRLSDRLAHNRAQSETIEANISRLTQLDSLTNKLRAASSLRQINEILTGLPDFGDPAAVQETLNERIAELTRRHDELTQQREAAQTTLSLESERVQSMAALVAALADQIRELDTACPVCSAAYHPGELARRAQAAAIVPGPAAQEIARLISDTTQELGRVFGQLSLARSRVEEVKTVVASRQRHEAERARLVQVLGPGDWTGGAVEELQAQVLDLSEEIEAADEINVRTERADFEEQKRRLALVSSDLQTQLALVERELAALASDTAVGRLEADLRGELRAIDLEIDRTNTELNAAASEHGYATQLAEGAADGMKRLRELRALAAKSLRDETVRRDQARTHLTALLGEHSEDNLATVVQRQSGSFGRLLERIALIREELGRVQQARDGDDDLALLRATYLPSTERPGLSELRQAITTQLEQSRAHRLALDALRKRLSQRARARRDVDKQLQGSALKPWNSLFRSVYTSMAGSLGETLEWTADRVDMRYNEIESRVRPAVAGEPIPGWLAGHYFSEGQLAALQISAMITASVLLPWSRWKALLLDDPLQHADVIKVGAFADMIRALSSDMKHQIIMTTHDRVQADFIAAKFVAGGLNAQIIQFDRKLPSHQSLG